MKITEVRKVIEKYSDQQLRLMVVELYRVIPKKIKEEKSVDTLVADPDKFVAEKKRGGRTVKLPDIDLLQDETGWFIADVREGYYFGPNRVVPKSQRAKWRFTVKKFYKEWVTVAAKEENRDTAIEYLEKLYILLCNAEEKYLFVSDEPFQAIGIAKEEFLRQIFALKFATTDKEKVIEESIKLIVDHTDYPQTEELTALVDFLKTPDLKDMSIARAKKILEQYRQKHNLKKITGKSGYNWSGDFEYKKKMELLATLGFICYCYLNEFDNAAAFLKKNIVERDREVKLYILLRLLFDFNLPGLWLSEYEAAVAGKVQPRDGLKKTYRYIKENGTLPEYFS